MKAHILAVVFGSLAAVAGYLVNCNEFAWAPLVGKALIVGLPIIATYVNPVSAPANPAK